MLDHLKKLGAHITSLDSGSVDAKAIQWAVTEIEKSALDHSDAWNVAHFTAVQTKANLARCYIELRQLARKASDGPMNVVDTKRLREIVRANDV